MLVLAAGAWAQNPEVGGNHDSGDFDYSKVDLRVGVWLDRGEDEIYQRGEEMGAGFQTNQDAYAVIYRIDVDGLVTVLWPRSRMDDGFVFGGHEYLLPVAGGRKLLVSNREGEGYVEAVVSKYPFDLRDLEIDFHHEPTAQPLDFRVAGDPFLALNEVNFAVTGLENSEEYVVTNFVSYFVHREVEHPRYLCNQCHFEDEVAYEPYQESCTLEITYDYGWVNGWYADYGYFPVYANPVYVYVDPWTWRPWVNFWYSPYYVCAPYYGYGWYGGGCYSWGYSPYYAGNCYTSYSSGYTRYRPLTRDQVNGSGSATKTREYGSVSRMVSADTPDARQREAMSTRTRVSDFDGVKGRSNNLATTGARGGAVGGVKAESRARPQFDDAVRTRTNAGLRIRGGGSTASRSRSAVGREVGSDFRHRAGGSGGRSGLVPVNRGSDGPSTVRGSSRSRTGGDVTDRKINSGSRGSTNQRTLNPVTPRQKGTRVWNSGRSAPSNNRNSRTQQVRPGSSRSGRSSSGDRTPTRSTVKSRKNQKGTSGTSKPRQAVKPKSSGSSKKSSGSRKSSSMKSNNSGSKSGSGGSRSSGSRSGGSRSGGGSRGGSRGGGTSSRR
jgi:hypothetical protein